MRILVSTLVLLAWSLPAVAKDKHLPLPSQLLAAKTVYIDNRSGYAAIADRAYQELTGWGRFRVVQDRSQAELIFLLTSTFDADVNYSGLTVVDAKTGDGLWMESKVARPLGKSAIKRAVEELRKRIDEESAKPKRK